VYKAFGAKAAIARSLNDMIDEEGRAGEHAARIAQATDPSRAPLTAMT
jgi:hypothetical protein